MTLPKVPVAAGRARMLASLEACAWAAAGAALAAGVALALHASRGVTVGVAFVAAAVGACTYMALRWRPATAASAVICRLEQAEPGYDGFRNADRRGDRQDK